MKNIDKIFEYNKGRSYSVKVERGSIYYRENSEIFSGETIYKIISFINSIHKKYKNINIPIIFSFGNVKLADKLSYILFECICYFLITKYRHRVSIFWRPQNGILTEGIFSSPLKLLNGAIDGNFKKYFDKFKMDICKNHYRRVVSGDEKSKTNYLGNLLQEIDSFLKYFMITEESRDQISEVITELVGNACEHGKADCLLDIDITSNHLKEVEHVRQDGIYYGINIAIVDFSEVLLGRGIKSKIDNNCLETERYLELKRAYNYHSRYFTTEYSYDDFCNIAVLQDKISGRMHHNLVGGTGLTKLIKSLQEKSDSNSCYVLSGKRCVIFNKELISYDNDGWIGFNKNTDFFNMLPDMKAISGCYIYLPGTAYNLNFVMRRED